MTILARATLVMSPMMSRDAFSRKTFSWMMLLLLKSQLPLPTLLSLPVAL